MKLLAWLHEVAAYLGASPGSRLRQMERLRELDERMLRDIGLTRADVLRGRPECSTNRPVEPAERPALRQERA